LAAVGGALEIKLLVVRPSPAAVVVSWAEERTIIGVELIAVWARVAAALFPAGGGIY